MNELVSVYMPTRNRLKLLQRAITSVLGQSYPRFELVVVNDGSTDATCIYLDQLQIADARVRAIHNESSVGAPRSRNMAIQTASGEFVTGLDDDDYFHRDRLQALIEHWHALEQLQQHFSSVFTQDIVIKGEKHTLSAKPRSVNADDLFFYNAIGNQIFTRRRHFIDAGLFDEAMPAWQDLDAFIRVLRKFGPAKLLDRGLYFLNIDPRPDRISVGSKQKLLAAYRRLAEKNQGLSAMTRQALLLQAFGGLYGSAPAVSDLVEFFRYGIHSRTMKRLAGVYVRRVTGIW